MYAIRSYYELLRICREGGLRIAELMLYQTLLGSWPARLTLADTPARRAYAGRVGQWQTKALREARLRSSS